MKTTRFARLTEAYKPYNAGVLLCNDEGAATTVGALFVDPARFKTFEDAGILEEPSEAQQRLIDQPDPPEDPPEEPVEKPKKKKTSAGSASQEGGE